MWRRLRKNRATTLGFVILTMGSFAAVLGAVAIVNHSESCYVLPGPFPPCIADYRFPLLAPLYPIGAVLMGLGIAAAILGTTFAFVGYSKSTGKEPSIPPATPGN